jgi:molybdopterin/thiamine biosynthesis adenylyltransferase
MTRLSDEQIERYSRQLILAEVGPRGQERLGAARVAVVGTGAAAERVVAYLAAAGVGWIAADASLHAAVDPAQPDCLVVPVTAVDAGGLDAAIIVSASWETLATDVATWSPQAATTFWIAGDRAGCLPPAPTPGTPASAAPLELATLCDTLLGTVVATEVVKAVLEIGTLLRGQVLTYDPLTATVTSMAADG